MEAEKGGILGLNATSRSYGVPITTQTDRISGRILHGTKPGSTPNLPYKYEKELVTFLKQASARLLEIRAKLKRRTLQWCSRLVKRRNYLVTISMEKYGCHQS